ISGGQDLTRNPGDLGGNLEAEYRVPAELGFVQLSGKSGPEHGASMAELHAGADPIRAAGPSGVDQPDPGLVLGNPLAEHGSIDPGMQREERSPEARTEGGGGLGDAALRAGHLGRIA